MLEKLREVYQYIAVGFGALFLVPQIVSGYRTGSLRDVSTGMLVCVVIGTGLWSFYMYEGGQYLYLYATSFICSNALLLILMALLLEVTLVAHSSLIWVMPLTATRFLL